MKTITKTIEVYKFNELPENIQEKAISNLYDINVDHEWWDFTFEDAKQLGIKITEFDLGRGQSINGEFLWSAHETAQKIIDEHGDECGTYLVSSEFLKARDAMIDQAPRDEDGEFEDEYALDCDLDELESEYQKDILNEYLAMLGREYEYLTSEEAIKESIEVNDYDFTEDGALY